MSSAVIDLRSDTVTRPDAEMRRLMMEAVVGDHVLGDDPTANELEAFCAELLGKDWALFMPSGTMANQVAVLIQAPRGTEVVVDHAAHLVHLEECGAAATAGVQLRTVQSPDGIPDRDAYEALIRSGDRFVPVTSLICVENTHNAAGGRVTTVERMREIADLATERGIAVHLDGARLPNAAAELGRDMKEWAALADTVMISLSKGLGAPIGSVLAGTEELRDAAWRARRRLGGGMRQAGILAAAALHALRNNFERLREDHQRARMLADGLKDIPGIRITPPETNIVMLEIEPEIGSVEAFVSALASRGVLLSRFGPRRLRAVTHLDISDADIDGALTAISTTAAAIA